MICKPCRQAGNLLASKVTDAEYTALVWYRNCKGGTWCDRNPDFPKTLEKK